MYTLKHIGKSKIGFCVANLFVLTFDDTVVGASLLLIKGWAFLCIS